MTHLSIVWAYKSSHKTFSNIVWQNIPVNLTLDFFVLRVIGLIEVGSFPLYLALTWHLTGCDKMKEMAVCLQHWGQQTVDFHPWLTHSKCANKGPKPKTPTYFLYNGTKGLMKNFLQSPAAKVWFWKRTFSSWVINFWKSVKLKRSVCKGTYYLQVKTASDEAGKCVIRTLMMVSTDQQLTISEPLANILGTWDGNIGSE